MRRALFAGIVLLSTFLSGIPFSAHAVDLDVVGTTTASGVANVPVSIDVQVTGDPGVTVPVKLYVPSGTLAMSTTTGLTFSGPSTGSTIYFSGTLENVNTALDTLTYTRTSAGSVTLEVSLVGQGEVFFPENGHLYEYVSLSANWTTARDAAALRSKYGAVGYLTTITSAEENAFVAARLLNAGWMGASDSVSEGDWKWVTGPEAGTSFWSGLSGGSSVDGRYANWGTGEPNDSGGEDCAQFLTGGTGKWNDLPCTTFSLPGYVVEYGAPGNMPQVAALDIAIIIATAPTVSTLAPADNATAVSESANLVMVFSQAVSVDSGSVRIYKTSDDSLVETISVTSEQVTGSGTTTITVNPSTILDQLTSYYVQVSSTAFKNASDIYYAGIANTTTWNFTTGDSTPPTISSISSDKANGSYKAGEVIDIDVTFSEAVTSTGNVTITLETGVTDRTCVFTVSASTTATCDYTVQEGDTTADLTVSSVSGVIKDSVNNTLVNFVPSVNLGANKNIVIDTTAPVLSVVTPAPSVVNRSTVTYSFSTTEEGDYLVENCGTDQDTLIDGINHVFTLQGMVPGSTYSCGFVIVDEAGNASNQLTVGPVFYAHNGLVSVPVTVPTILAGKSDFAINNNARMTQERFVTVSLNADPATSARYALSIDPNFGDTGQKPYSPTVLFMLPEAAGVYTLYVKYFSETGHGSEVFSKSIEYRPSAVKTTEVKVTEINTTEVERSENETPFRFTRTLRSGMTDSQVLQLQQFLNTQGFTIAKTGAGSPGNETTYFGPSTRRAVILFQEKYPESILTPINREKGTGIFASLSINQANKLLK